VAGRTRSGSPQGAPHTVHEPVRDGVVHMEGRRWERCAVAALAARTVWGSNARSGRRDPARTPGRDCAASSSRRLRQSKWMFLPSSYPNAQPRPQAERARVGMVETT